MGDRTDSLEEFQVLSQMAVREINPQYVGTTVDKLSYSLNGTAGGPDGHDDLGLYHVKDLAAENSAEKPLEINIWARP